MKKIFLAVSLLGTLMFALAVHAAAPTNFAGTWALDKSKSQGLSQRMQGVDTTWVITQDAKSIAIEQKISGGDTAGSGGGGGRGMGMGGPQSYNLDGSETSGEMGQGGKWTRQAKWAGDGSTVELSSKSTFNGPNGEVTTTTTQKLQLSSDGKVLTVNRHTEGGRAPGDSTWVFNKQ
jgi:hypothetical protein